MRLFIIILLLFPNLVFSQVVKINSIQSYFDLIKDNSQAIKQFEMQSLNAHYDYNVSKSALMPSIMLNASSEYNLKLPLQLIPAQIFGGEPGTFNEVRFGQSWNSSLGGSFEMPIIHADKIAGIKASSNLKKQAEQDAITNEKNYLKNAANAYLSYLVLKEAYVLNLELDTTAQDLYAATKARYDQNLASKIELNRAENLLLSTHQQTIDIQSKMRIGENQIKTLAGIALSSDLIVEDQMANYGSLNQENEVSPKERTEVKSAEFASEAAKWNLKQQRWAFLPKLSFNSRYTYANQTDELFSGNGTNFDFGTVGLTLSMPIFKGFSQYNKQKKAKNQFMMSNLKLEQTVLDSENQISEYQIKYQEKVNSALMAEKRAKLSSTSLDLSLLNYDDGVISLDQLFNIYSEYVQAQNNRLQNFADAALYSTWLDLEK